MKRLLPVLLLLAGCNAPPAANDAARKAPEKADSLVIPRDDRSAAKVLTAAYFRELQRGNLRDAHLIWSGDPAPFEAQMATYVGYQVRIGEPGRVEGAAGSLYVSVPIEIVGDVIAQSGEVILRRPNTPDLPKGVIPQVAWQIQRIDLKPAAY
ncbi:MAG TPA: hypothetical protein VD906_04755 [Caulobacteraceae bacterium]|nr:hypothetical protein [Caulobacteraceae bacterium]